jgi:hypothetical protein
MVIKQQNSMVIPRRKLIERKWNEHEYLLEQEYVSSELGLQLLVSSLQKIYNVTLHRDG